LEKKTNLIIFSEVEIRSLALPSREQHQAFVEHLRDVHSWYKHLPLLIGGKFIVFLAPDAGECYSASHSLPYENTIDGYRRAFGYLDYMWSVENCPFSRDNCHTGMIDGIFVQEQVVLPSDLIEQCEFVLYPYVSNEQYWCVHEDAIESLRAGTPHPARTQILEWKAAAEAMDREAEVSEQMRLEQEECTIYASLQIQEVARIEQHLNRLYQWHSGVESFQLTSSDD
jgi:hypothetical protein